jgi:adenylosuccinate lyase
MGNFSTIQMKRIWKGKKRVVALFLILLHLLGALTSVQAIMDTFKEGIKNACVCKISPAG